MPTRDFQKQAITLIDDLKGVCANYGLGNDGNEFKIITQIFLYKFLNDKFAHEVKRIDPKLAKAASWEDTLRKTKKADYEMLLMQLGDGTAQLRPEHFLSTLYSKQNEENFAKTLDATLLSIAALNSEIFSVMTDDGEKQPLFDPITEYVANKRNEFARALVNKLVNFSFERIFAEKFDCIVSNPPFKLDFSDFRDELDTPAHRARFFAGIPKVPNKDKDKMSIYLLFIQHIIHSLAKNGKAAIVVPTGFITAQSGIEKGIRQHLVEHKMLAGVVSMPSNIFATTGTNVSILFLDAANKGDIVLIDASNLGTKVKDGKNQKTLLSTAEEDQIIRVFNHKEIVEDFSVVVSYEEIAEKNHSFSAGQYFDVKVDHVKLTPAQFEKRLSEHKERLKGLFDESHGIEKRISKQLSSLSYE